MASSLLRPDRIMPAYVRLRPTILKSAQLSSQADPDLWGASMEKEYIDRAKAIREGILQLRDSL
jgi:hypothetical protein